MRIYIIILIIGAIIVTGCSSKKGETMTEQEVLELIELYQQGAGADDIAGPKLKSGGEQSKQLLIKLLDDPTTPEEIAGTSAQILHVYFPSDESYDAMDRFVDRIENLEEREKNKKMMQMLRAMPRER